MSQRYKGGIISATPPTTSTSSATGIWTEQSVFQAVGAGTWPGVPGAPTSVTATDTTAGGAISVAFTAPANNGGSAITNYTVTSSPGSITASGASSPITVTGLTNGTSYTFTVRATNATGTGPASAASNSATPTVIVYVEDVFSTFIYTGTGANQVITNNINLSANGGLVWAKNRGTANGHYLIDTVRGGTKILQSNTTGADITTGSAYLTAQTTGYQTGPADSGWNGSGQSMVSWTFQKQAKFFDIVTYTGTGVARAISHNLGSVPGCMIVKKTSGTENWLVYHRGLGSPDSNGVQLNTTAGQQGPGITSYWNNTLPTSTQFTVGTNNLVNQSGATYVAYLFAHDAGGFGLTGADNVISCGSFTTNSSALGQTVNLGYEPQWILTKEANGVRDWQINDTMRGLPVGGQGAYLEPNTSDVEAEGNPTLNLTATGFYQTGNGANATYIYIAIRKSPMKVPTLGTAVFSPNISDTFNSVNTIGFRPDAQIWALRGGAFRNSLVVDRLRGVGTGSTTNDGVFSSTGLPDAEFGTGNGTSRNWDNTSFRTPGYGGSTPEVFWTFQRAPRFFDEVCYIGNAVSGRQIPHNLTVAPELLIIKDRAYNTWVVAGNMTASTYFELYLDSTQAAVSGSALAYSSGSASITAAPTSTTFGVGPYDAINGSGKSYFAYLFATLAGISKVGTYTGTAALQTVNCGFTTGARFVLVKRTDSTSGWYVWDSARGITSGNDPYLLLNSSAAEVTGTNYVDSASTGFQVTAAAPAALNASGGTYLFLAIA